MALAILLQYLKEDQRTMDIQLEGNIIKDVKINFYDLSNNRLFVYLNKGHELRIDITKFKKVVFNAVSPGAQTPIEMLRCLYHLRTEERFNAYLVNEKDEIFLNFLFICDGNRPAYLPSE